MTKILLVEDDKSLREIYGVRLLAEGYDIVSAGDGEEALAIAIKDRPQLIISDVMMPKISGFDMLDILRSTTETKNIKVIMMTALSSEDQRARGEQLGADRYLVKSQVGIEDVVRTVHEVLGDAPTSGSSMPAPQPGQVPASRPSTPVVPQRPITQPAPQPSTPPVYNGSSIPNTPAPTLAPQPQQPQPQQSTGLPQPTAPFSTSRPTGLGLSDRVINPLPKEESKGPDINVLMEKELASSSNQVAPAEVVRQPEPESREQPTQPTASPSVPPAPTPPPVPTQPTQAPQQPSTNPFVTQSQPQAVENTPGTSSGIDFEETPRPQTPPSEQPGTPAPNTNPFLQN